MQASPWVLRFEMKDSYCTPSILMTDIAKKVRGAKFRYPLECWYSDDNNLPRVMHVRVTRVVDGDAVEEEETGFTESVALQAEQYLLELLIRGNILSFFSMPSHPNHSRPPQGVEGLSKFYISKQYPDTEILCNGTNLKGLLEFEGIDHSQTYATSPRAMAEVFGIEAGRAVLFRVYVRVSYMHILISVSQLLLATAECA